MHTAFLSIGTNIGDRLANIKAAIAALSPAVCLVDSSPVYETLPWGYTDQNSFLNQVLKVETDLDPQGLLAYLKSLEKKLGRKKTFRYGPRLIDLDILFYDDLVIEMPELTIPHPHMTERAFVIVPLLDLAPGLIHPKLGKTVKDIAEKVDPSSVSLYQDNPYAT